MIVDKEIINEMQNYLDRFMNVRREFVNSFDELKNNCETKIIDTVIDKMNEIKTVVVPNELDLKEKLEFYLNGMIDNYYNEITAFMNFNDKVLNDFTEKKDDKYNVDFQSINEILYSRNLSYVETPKDELTYKVSDTILSHIGFRNQYNSEYYKISREVEAFLREEVQTKLEELNKDTTELYNYTVQGINNMKDNFVEQSATYYQNEMLKQNEQVAPQSVNEKLFIEDELESENAKLFK